MKSSLQGPPPPYLGADLTDRYAKKPRPVDVCGLTPRADGSFDAKLWTWTWGTGTTLLDASAIVDELNRAKVSMLDGPIGLASPGQQIRDCERASGAVGKTPDVRPSRRPFATYICSSLDLFDALAVAGLPIDVSAKRPGAFECYPGRAWMSLGQKLAKKSTAVGLQQRQAILQALGVKLGKSRPTHDELDACLGALLAAALDGKASFSVVALGIQATRDKNGALREGRMWIPKSVKPIEVSAISAPTLAAAESKQSKSTRKTGRVDPEVVRRAQQLLARLGDDAEKGSPRVITYQATYRELFRHAPDKWSQGYAAKVVGVAAQTEPIHVLGLGTARLDTFVVNQDRLPGKGHWEAVTYEPEDWERVFGGAELTDVKGTRRKK